MASVSTSATEVAMPEWALPVAALILVGVYALIVTEVVHRALAAALGAIVAVGALAAAGDVADLDRIVGWVDAETIGLLFGMMVMVSILQRTGLFEYAAVQAYKRSEGSVWRLVVLLCVVTAVLSAFLDNVTTMILITPVTIRLAQVLDLDPVPILIAEILFSNIGGTATMIGDPPNIIIGAQLSASALEGSVLADQALTFTQFFINLAPGALLCGLPALWMIRRMEKEALTGFRYRDVEELEAQYKIKDWDLLVKSGSVLGIVILAFFAHSAFHHPLLTVATIAITGAVIMLLITHPHRIEDRLDDVEWTTLVFFAGLFVLIHSLEAMGLIDRIAKGVADLIGSAPENWRLLVAIMLLLWVSAIASAFIDNIPYTATMVPVVLTLAANPDLGLDLAPLAWALAFGACLGGNGTIIGASANVVTAGLAEDAGYRISFNRFFMIGFPMMLMTLTIASAYCVVMYILPFSQIVRLGIVAAAFVITVLIGRFIGPESITNVELDEPVAEAE